MEGLLREHSVHEMEYTPDVYDARKVLDWREEVAMEGMSEYTPLCVLRGLLE